MFSQTAVSRKSEKIDVSIEIEVWATSLTNSKLLSLLSTEEFTFVTIS